MKKGLAMSLFLLFALTFNVIGQNTVTVSTDTNQIDNSFTVVTPYFFQHQYLSVIAQWVPESDSYIFEDPNHLNTITPAINGFKSPFADSDISVEKVNIGGKDIIVWKFPEPEYLRESLYMAFIPVDGKYMAFAISIGQMVDWEISTSTKVARSTYGRVKKPESARECVKLLIDRGALTGTISMGQPFQDNYTAPEYRPQH